MRPTIYAGSHTRRVLRITVLWHYETNSKFKNLNSKVETIKIFYVFGRMSSYEPELHPGCTYRLSDIGATLKIFSTGSITITGKSVDAIQKAVEKAYSLVYEFKKERRIEDLQNYPIHERKKRRRELRLLQEQLTKNKSKKGKNKSIARPPKKRARRSRDAYEDDGPASDDDPVDDFEELDSILNLKTPIEVDESEEEDSEEDFDSDVSHD